MKIQSMKIRSTILLFVAIVALALVLFGPLVLDRFSLNVLTRSMIYALLAITVDLLWGFTGILTFGQAAFFGIGAYATAMVLAHVGASPALMAAAFLLAIIVPILLGLLVGWLSFYHNSTALYASVISLVFPIEIVHRSVSPSARPSAASAREWRLRAASCVTPSDFAMSSCDSPA